MSKLMLILCLFLVFVLAAANPAYNSLYNELSMEGRGADCPPCCYESLPIQCKMFCTCGADFKWLVKNGQYRQAKQVAKNYVKYRGN
ncbi:unnamed protein product [Cyprideis torosa]|uniref:Uncharacterized protein n=1 Tax=Cyprideis torosa TaxID=163714 RepID=A0A7R8W6M8_9CRUS|nr:unnamed protein product [Cyprideis torosa]CAG0884254.1 unnamed protein product [Cyprideis torosa]